MLSLQIALTLLAPLITYFSLKKDLRSRTLKTRQESTTVIILVIMVALLSVFFQYLADKDNHNLNQSINEIRKQNEQLSQKNDRLRSELSDSLMSLSLDLSRQIVSSSNTISSRLGLVDSRNQDNVLGSKEAPEVSIRLIKSREQIFKLFFIKNKTKLPLKSVSIHFFEDTLDFQQKPHQSKHLGDIGPGAYTVCLIKSPLSVVIDIDYRILWLNGETHQSFRGYAFDYYNVSWPSDQTLHTTVDLPNTLEWESYLKSPEFFMDTDDKKYYHSVIRKTRSEFNLSELYANHLIDNIFLDYHKIPSDDTPPIRSISGTASIQLGRSGYMVDNPNRKPSITKKNN